MLRIADIAKELNVSRSLVSKVLSGRMGSSSVRPALAEAIRAKAVAISYRPNVSAMALNNGRQHVVGIFIRGHGHGQPGSGLIESFMNGVADEMANTNQRMLLQFFMEPLDFGVCEAIAHRNALDGVLLTGRIDFDLSDALRRILDRKVPVVTMLSKPLLPEIPNVGIDHFEIGRAATRHLIERGCKRPACLHVSDQLPHFEGYKAALQEAGLPFAPELTFSTHAYEADAIPSFITDLQAKGIPFDGVVAASDHQASITLRALMAVGRRVPQDVKLIGVDDSPLCNYCVVPLSSVSGQDRKRAGLAVKLLQEVIEGRPVQNIILPPVVMARESTATGL